ncbi:MAG: ABC-2 family transporter protein [Anaerolineales bacterium]|nr:ABC-2 family transporter protein [Anaerolineales bacterium]
MNAPALPAGIRTRPQWKYLSLAAMAMQSTLNYRRVLFANFASNLIWVVIFYFLWQAVFAANAQIGYLNWDRMRTYLVLAYVATMLINGSNSIWTVIASIRFGDIALVISKPYDFFFAHLAMVIGPMLIEGLLAGGLAVLGGGFLLHILPPASLSAAVLFLLSLLLGSLTRFLVLYITSLLCFWTINWLGIYWTYLAVTNLFSGGLIPLVMFPDWLRTVAMALPFQAIINTPILIYLGEIRGADVLSAIGVQLFWIIALWIVSALMWKPCLRALEIQGG